MTIDALRDLLIDAELITENVKPNSSKEYLARCFNCDKKKLYVKADPEKPEDIGVHFCQSCETKGNGYMLQQKFAPLSEEQQVYKTFHEYAVRQLLENPEVLQSLIKERDFTEADIATFGFGYVGKHFIPDLTCDHGLTRDQLKAYGFIKTSEDTGIEHGVFWDHLIIPYITNGEYDNFKGRICDPTFKGPKYIGLAGHQSKIYMAGDLRKQGRVFLTEGEFKAAYMKSNGFNSAGISGANNFRSYIAALKACEDLWIVLDADAPTEKDPIGVGQSAAIAIAKELDKCHVVSLPLSEGVKKVGVDDYLRQHGNEAFEQLLETADYYEDGVKQKPRALAIVVNQWALEARKRDKPIGYRIANEDGAGFPRLDEWWRGVHPGSLVYIIGAPHNGKTALLRWLSIYLYDFNPDLRLDYWTNDDSLRETLPHYVAAIAHLNSTDCSEPTIAFADNRRSYVKWEDAVAELEQMSKRLTILDRSYKVAMEDIYEDLARWRELNPDGQRVLLIDGFRKIFSREALKFEGNDVQSTLIKSDQLKRIAQEINIPVISTIEPPKLYGRRPRSFDIANSSMGEFDANIIVGCYIEAQSKGVDGTDIKMVIDYDDSETETLPIIEVNTMKNKQNDINDLDLFALKRRDSQMFELDDNEYHRNKKAVLASENGEKKKDKQSGPQV